MSDSRKHLSHRNPDSVRSVVGTKAFEARKDSFAVFAFKLHGAHELAPDGFSLIALASRNRLSTTVVSDRVVIPTDEMSTLASPHVCSNEKMI
jgi:hypothetical protein